MRTISTLALELLRHGRPDGQLLSPFTPYLALYGKDGEAESANVDLDHYQMLRRIRQVRYPGGKPATPDQLNDAADPPTTLLRALGGFREALGGAVVLAGEGGMVNIHLVLSAAELELLPFELSRDQTGDFLALRPGVPVLFTRQVRGAVMREAPVVPPRILFITTSRATAVVEPELVKRHAAALLGALSPWIVSSDPTEFARHLNIVTDATREKVNAVFQIAEQEGAPYTHVHVLAHGVEQTDPDIEERRYSVAFSDGEDIGGADLAQMLAGNAHTCPAVVTMATCDSGAQGSVVAAGASVAHHLHKKGVPLVVASQFPMTKENSATFAEILYGRLLAGDDPREALHTLRDKLAQTRDNHDWASVIAYTSFPHDAAERQATARLELARSAVEAAAARMDRAEKGSPAGLDAANAKLTEAFKRLEALVPKDDDPLARARAVELLGVLANAKKRAAEIMWQHDKGANYKPMLREARVHYQRAFRLDMNEIWAEVQQISLAVVLGEPLRPGAWAMIDDLAVRNAQQVAAQDARRRIWALNNLVELYVLAHGLGAASPPGVDAPAEARAQVDALLVLLDGMPAVPRDAYSLLRQLKRYQTWWWQGLPHAQLAEELVQVLVNGNVPETWDSLG